MVVYESGRVIRYSAVGHCLEVARMVVTWRIVTFFVQWGRYAASRVFHDPAKNVCI